MERSGEICPFIDLLAALSRFERHLTAGTKGRGALVRSENRQTLAAGGAGDSGRAASFIGRRW